jgi:hypothetical protein
VQIVVSKTGVRYFLGEEMIMLARKTASPSLKKYSKPQAHPIAKSQVLLDLLERAEDDMQLAAHLKMSIHQGDPDYVER